MLGSYVGIICWGHTLGSYSGVMKCLRRVFRYELEQQLLAGDVSIQDVPRRWNEKMTEYLGCTPKDDAQGVLQDVHWSAGIMGYFPTYSLGAMYACQIYQVGKVSLISKYQSYHQSHHQSYHQSYHQPYHHSWWTLNFMTQTFGTSVYEHLLSCSLGTKYACQIHQVGKVSFISKY